MAPKKTILELLKEGPVVGDGSMCMTLEKRGYCRAGPWTPEAVVLYPEGVRQLLREYLRAGSDVLQTPCFYSSDGKLEVTRGKETPVFKTADFNKAACVMAREVANEGEAVVCGSLSPVISFTRGRNLEQARKEFKNQLEPFIEHNVDFVLAEFFNFVEEVELCVDVMKKSTNKPIACTMRIGEMGDEDGHSVEECAVRMAKTGADIIGINCMYDIDTNLKTLRRMKKALDAADLHPYLMVQPLGFRCPEVEHEPQGYLALPEAPLALDSRVLTRIEAAQFARSAYEIGVRYIGGCCGMEPHHMRAIAQELAPERKRPIPVADMDILYGGFLKYSAVNTVREKCENKEFWNSINIGSGRPYHTAISKPQENVECK